MELDFDKEIDALLRQTAQSGDFGQNRAAPHLDADEISAFAENALPEKARQRSVAHLADCDKCRKILSNIIALNSETESEMLHHAEEKALIASPIPWYRKLFVFPSLAYTMGALVLVFSGIIVYTVLQSAGNSRNAEVSQTYEKQPNGKGMSSDGDAATSETFSSNSAMSSNMTTATNAASMNSAANAANPAIPAAPMLMNSNAAAPRDEQDKVLKAETKSLAPPSEPLELAKTPIAPPPPMMSKEDEDRTADLEIEKQRSQTQNSIAQNQTQIMPDSRNVQRAPMPSARLGENKSRSIEESKDDAKLKKSSDTTNVGGKTFKRENNVWYDATYRGQATVNVTRGTSEYKKLDFGLRAIAENLGGTVVVVWKQKAYRIQ